MVSAKGKEKVPAGGGGKGKRKFSGGDDKTGGGQKRKNRGVLQFFDDAAYQVDEDEDSSDDSMFDDDDFFEDEFGSELKSNNETGKVPQFPFIPKEEEMSEEEFERILEERYRPGAGFVTYAEDGNEHNASSEREIYLPSAKDPKIWKVKCTVGRERYSALCLMQKYVDLGPLGTKLQIVSALALDHVKGSIFIEAEKQNDIYEASKGLSTIYASRSAPLPNNEISRLLSVRSKSSGISEGMWARVKNGKYKGDLALVMAVNNGRKKVTVKLVPRIDLKAMAGKFGEGVTTKKTAIPPQRLISSSELDEFRPLIHCRRDRDTNEMVEVLDGMMLKDGYLYKKISIDSLSFWGVMPTEDELLKFEPSKKNETTDVQWLSQLFGDKKKKQAETLKQGKGGGKSGGSSSASVENNFEMHELVFFGRKDFGVVLGTEKDDTVKVIKEGPEGQSVVNVKQSELKSASFDKKLFSVLDQNSKTISINDSVRVLDGPLKDRQGIVKKIYKGVVFLYDESEQETNGYICVKACLCEKVNLSGKTSNEKGSEPGPSSFEDLPPSPKTPLSSDRTFPERDNKSNFKREDNGMFSVGQPLRIKVGPLKGYLCRVLAVRRSDVTVKLDSQHKILTVKSEHLSEVGGRNRAISHGEESGSIKPFDFLGTQDGARDWMDGTAPPAEGNKWNAGGSTERSSWSAALPSSSFSIPKDSSSADDDAKKGTEDSGWQVGSTSNQNSPWGAAAADKKLVSDTRPADGLGTSNGWNQATSSAAVNIGPDSWGKASEPRQDTSVETEKNDSWGKAAEKWSTVGDNSGSKAAWGQSGASSEKQTGGWGNAGLAQPEASSWKKDSGVSDQSRGNTCQGTAVASESGWKISADTRDGQTKNWDVAMASEHATDNNPIEGWNKPKPVGADSGPSWHKQDDKSTLGQLKGTSSWSKQDGGSTWSTGGTSSWGKQPDVNATDGLKGWKEQNNHSENSKDSEGDEGFGSWKKDNRDDTFDGGRGSGGRRGRGGDRGGRGQYGRGRSQGQSTNWNKEGQYGSSDAGNHSSWSRDQTSGWGKAVSTDGIKKNDVESNVSVEGGWHTNKDGGKGGVDWGIGKPDEIKTSGGWNISKSYNSESSDWGRISTKNEEAGAAGKGHDSWGKGNKPNDDNKSSWNTQTTSVDGNQSSEWNTKGGWGSQKASEPNAEGGSSTGWGQSNWSKSGTSDSTWGSKSNWSSGNGFQASDNQDDASGDGGRGGSWRGGRGGRGDRGGFRGRGRSDRGGFGGRGGSSWGGGSDRGGFGGRGGSDGEGGFRGRGGGFRGRGRGDWNNRAGDSNVEKTNSWSKGSDAEGWKSSGSGGSWNQTGTDNNQRQNQNSSWNQPSQGGSWNQGGGDNNQLQSWNQPKVEGSSAAGGWGKGLDSNKDSVQTDTGVGGWGSSNASAKEGSGGWGKPPANKETVGWGKQPANKEAGDWNSKGTATSDRKESVQTDTGVSGWGSSNASAKEGSGGWGKPPASKEAVGWGKPSANKEAGNWNSKGTATSDPKESVQTDTGVSGWGSSNASAKEGSGGWGKPPANKEAGGWNSKGMATSDPTEKGQVEKSNTAEGSDGTWGKPAASSWGAASGSGNWKKPETTTSDPIEKGQVEKLINAEGSDGTWGKGLSKDGGPSDSSWGSGSKKGGW